MEKTDNELIAEFMGFEHQIVTGPFGGEYPSVRNRNEIKYCEWQSPNWDNSWDWLMPVYSKFSALDFDDNSLNDQHSNHCASIAEKVLSFDIFLAHEELSKAIKWYNALQPKTP